jgi:alpha-galactosidase
MAPRIVIVGGGSYQWVPKLFVDILNTPSLREAGIVLHDIDPAPLAPMVEFVQHFASLDHAGITVRSTTDLRDALGGADFVVVSISTGGFASMRHDLEIPERYGIKQSVGDSVGPGGITRALRNIPVLVGIARTMEEICPHAWLLNLTNPMTTLCRAVTKETTIKCVGLCHELAMARLQLSQLLDVGYRDVEVELVGVNHLPLLTRVHARGEDAFPRLREMVADPERVGAEPLELSEEYREAAAAAGITLTKRDLLQSNQVKLALFDRFGVWPAAGDRHLVEFFPGFLTESAQWGKRWGVALTTIEDRERDAVGHQTHLAELRSATEVPRTPSGEMVASVIDSFIRNKSRELPLNMPNAGQAPDLPADVVVEAICIADGEGIRGRDHTRVPPLLTEWLRRIIASQETTVEAALSGDRARAVHAMMLDPLAGRIDLEQLEQMTNDLLNATAAWLPQFV